MGLSDLLSLVHRQGTGLGFNLSYVLLSSLALPLTSYLGSQAFLAFTAIDKIQKQLVTVMLPVVQIVVGRMSRDVSSNKSLYDAAVASVRHIFISALLIFVVTIMASPAVVSLLSLGAVTLDGASGFAFSLLVSLAFTTQCIPIAVMAPLKRLRVGFWGNVAGALILLPAIILLGRSSITGVLVSADLAFGVSLAFLLFGVRDLGKVEESKRLLV